MEEASRESKHQSGTQPPAWRERTPLQIQILEFLVKNPRQKALVIAKGLGRKSSKEVNPDLYKMLSLTLLDYNPVEKLWSINTQSHAAECGTNVKSLELRESRPNSEVTEQREYPGQKECETNMSHCESRATGDLSEQQNKILHLLHKSKPMKAIEIARGIGRNSAREVNLDLYTLQKMGLLHKQEQLWTERSPGGREVTEKNGECEKRRRNSIESDGSAAFTASEKSDSPSRDISPRKCDTGSRQELAHRGPSTLTVINNFYLDSCKNFQIGDHNYQNCCKENLDPDLSPELSCQGDKMEDRSRQRDSGFGDCSAQEEEHTAQGEELQHQLSTNHTEGCSLLESEHSNGEDRQGHPPHTSSPISTRRSAEVWDVSGICESLQGVSLDEVDSRDGGEVTAPPIGAQRVIM